jgi:23S rRNA (cytidine1920-2'-O)/16S rRNA (cytidine1409-2'-O)-methyltransferase
MRLDQYLVTHGFARSRAQAVELIELGHVVVTLAGGQLKKAKPSLDVTEGLAIEVKETELVNYVSRSALKLKEAIVSQSVSLTDLCVLDIGQSTGGFTQVCLEFGAKEVVGVEVGHSQLAPVLANDKRVTVFEKTDIREFAKINDQKFNFVVCDVSFISLTKVLPELSSLMADSFLGVFLVKPQFEVGAKFLNKNGLVKSDAPLDEIKDRLIAGVKDIGAEVLYYIPCNLRGGDGNQEYLMGISK